MTYRSTDLTLKSGASLTLEGDKSIFIATISCNGIKGVIHISLEGDEDYMEDEDCIEMSHGAVRWESCLLTLVAGCDEGPNAHGNLEFSCSESEKYRIFRFIHEIRIGDEENDNDIPYLSVRTYTDGIGWRSV